MTTTESLIPTIKPPQFITKVRDTIFILALNLCGHKSVGQHLLIVFSRSKAEENSVVNGFCIYEESGSLLYD